MSPFGCQKKLKMEATQLSHPDLNGPIALMTDALKAAIGGMLEQFVVGQWQPLGFWSPHGPKPTY